MICLKKWLSLDKEMDDAGNCQYKWFENYGIAEWFGTYLEVSRP